MTAITDTMNPVEHSLILMVEYLQDGTDAQRSLDICVQVRDLAAEMDEAQKDEFRTRLAELVAA